MGLKAVGLVSGGKDSIFAMHCAHELGHQICAVATLLPRDGLLEADSYMYQSVGTGITATIAECLGVPCFSATVRGQPILTETLNYDTTKGDEVEDLHDLLLQVKASKRTRDWFWWRHSFQYCQDTIASYRAKDLGKMQEVLLREMIAWGLDAVVVKTASMGLSHKHLGRSIAELLPHFLSLNRQHGFHVCGEGGEYETLTLDCPLFNKGKIVVSKWDEVFQSEDPVAPVCLLSPAKWAAQRREQSDDIGPLADTAKLHAIELRRFQPYEEVLWDAIKAWSPECTALQIPLATPHGVKFYTEDSIAWNKEREWSVQVRANAAGCYLTADVSACSGDREEDEHYFSASTVTGGQHALRLDLQESVFDATGKWLRGLLSGDHEAKGTSLVQTICQVRHSGFIPVVEELFASSSVRPHPVTFVVAPLPQGIILRFRMLFCSSISSTMPIHCAWKCPEDGALLHVHSLNWWLPPCPLVEHDGADVRRLKGCHSCQSVRCEPLSDGPTAAAHIFLRGCNGRFPHSGMLPDVVGNPSLQVLAAGSDRDLAVQQALNVSLQIVSAFLNLQQTLRLMQAGEASYDLPDAVGERNAEPEGGMEGTLGCTGSLPFCILTFVKLGNSASSAFTMDGADIEVVGKLTVIKDLVKGLVARSQGCVTGEMQTEIPCIVIVAEVSNLPGGASALLLPLWVTTGRRGDIAKAPLTYWSTEQLQSQGARWKETITALKCHRADLPSSQGAVPEGSSAFVSISFEEIVGCEKQTSTNFLGQLHSAIVGVLENHFLLKHRDDAENFHASGKLLDTNVGKRVLEIFVFYSIACARCLWADPQTLEAECLEHILRACSGKTFASSEVPIVTFFPVRHLSQGFLEVTICSVV